GRLVVLAASAEPAPVTVDAAAAAGSATAAAAIVGVDRARGIGVACGHGTLWLARVRPAGRKEMSGADYANGARLLAGARLPVREGTA
ncbi:MAG TPA: hypothetical protein VFU59_10140, partial [Candidatus Eisenbacteria bacterium]|nr:hypothetical protein [Candidatus Eisenbacteria bacterium]